MRITSFLITILTLACHPRPEASSCDEMVEIVDYSQLDGCGYLLVTKSGEKLLATNAQKFDLQGITRVQVSYREVEDMSSICMSEDKIVEITCFSAEHAIPRKPPCTKYAGVTEGGWLEKVANEWRPEQVRRYNYLDGFIYCCKKGSTTKIYDCQGTLLCTMNDTNGCSEFTQSLDEEVVIWNSHR